MESAVPSPLVGEGGSNAPCAFETGEGLVQQALCLRIETPHPALRATFSHKGRRKGSIAIQTSRIERICVTVLAAPCARGLLQCRPLSEEGAGKAGRRSHPRSCTQGARVDHRATGSLRLSPRNGLRLIRDHPGDRAFLPPSPCGLMMPAKPGWARNISTGLDASVGASGQHDFAVHARLAKALAGPRTCPASFVDTVGNAVRTRAGQSLTEFIPPCNPLRARRCRVHRIPPRVRDVRNAPRSGGTGESLKVICPTC